MKPQRLWALKPPGVGRKESGGPAGQGRTCRNLHWREGRALGVEGASVLRKAMKVERYREVSSARLRTLYKI